MNAYDQALSLTALPADLQDYLAGLTGRTKQTDMATWYRLWDNLAYQLLRPTAPGFKDDLVKAIRLYYLLGTLQANRVDTLEELRARLRRIPVVPFDLGKVRGLHPAKPEDEDTEAPAEPAENPLGRLQDLQAARAAVEKLQKDQLAKAAAQRAAYRPQYDEDGHPAPDPDAPEPVDTSSLTDDMLDDMTTGEKAVVDAFDLPIERRTFAELIRLIDQQIEAAYRDAFPPHLAKVAKVYENGVLYVVDDGKTTDPPLHDIIPPYEPPHHGGTAPPEDPCRIKPVGVEDYRRVEAVWKRYEAGEVAHIENVLKGELKDRETRHLRRSEETYTLETIREKEVIRDLQTTERFALQKQASEIVQQDFAAKADAYVKGSTGTVSFGISGGVSVSNSSTKSKEEATQYAKDVIDRSVNRILERTREERTVKIIEEFEETNIHKLDNTNGTEHTVGVYRWVDKVMHCRLANYGKRMLFEFMVPEPAAFYIFAKSNRTLNGFTLSEPENPQTGISNPETSDTLQLKMSELPWTYKIWAAAYGIELDPYPGPVELGMALSDSMGQNESPGGQWWTGVKSDNSFKVPEGYLTDTMSIASMHSRPRNAIIRITVGYIGIDSYYWGNTSPHTAFGVPIAQYRDTVPISVFSDNSNNWAINVTIRCLATNEHLDAWHIKTYTAIMAAYERRLAEYRQALAEAQVAEGIQIEGDNPLTNRQTEQTELRKACLQLLNDEGFHYQWDAMTYPDSGTDDELYPHFDNCKAAKEGRKISFFETVFDWSLMSYFFYPYFYGKRKRWVKVLNTSAVDPLFVSFLQAGFARVVVPVRLGFEEAAGAFYETGAMNLDASFAGSTQDVMDALADVQQATKEGELGWATSDLNPANWPTWEVRLPTNLVILQESCPVDSATALPENPNV